MRRMYRPAATLALVLLAVGLIQMNGATIPAQEKVRPVPQIKWEYKQVSKVAMRDDELNQLGDEGWELVTVFRDQVQSPFNRFAFKRQKK